MGASRTHRRTRACLGVLVPAHTAAVSIWVSVGYVAVSPGSTPRSGVLARRPVRLYQRLTTCSHSGRPVWHRVSVCWFVRLFLYGRPP